MVVIYIFFPYFSSVVVGDPVRGQSLIGYINASVGFVLAATILFLGAIADTVGRRKPYILVTYGTIALGGFLLWWVKPGDAGLSLYSSVGLIFIIMVAFAYAEVFHNAMLPSVTPAEKAGERRRHVQIGGAHGEDRARRVRGRPVAVGVVGTRRGGSGGAQAAGGRGRGPPADGREWRLAGLARERAHHERLPRRRRVRLLIVRRRRAVSVEFGLGQGEERRRRTCVQGATPQGRRYDRYHRGSEREAL